MDRSNFFCAPLGSATEEEVYYLLAESSKMTASEVRT